MQIALNEYVRATFDASGIARATIGPQIYGTKWLVDRINVTSTSVLSSQCRVYLNAEVDTALFTGTYSGNQDSDDSDFTMDTLDKLIFVWSGGTVGAVATAIVTGKIETGRQ